jgi:thiol:disulfide interchange protein DsbC
MRTKTALLITIYSLLTFALGALWGREQINTKGDVTTLLPHTIQANPSIKNARPSPIKGLYFARIDDGEVLVSADGGMFVKGKLFVIHPSGITEWADPVVLAERKAVYDSINPKDTINFVPAESAKAVVYVFTDVDCGYCRKLHKEMANYTAAGIEVRYVAYPRAGISSNSADKYISAWCAADKISAMSSIMQGEDITFASCTNPVAEQFVLGKTVGLNGTPAILLPTGELKSGYLPAAHLAKSLRLL